MDEEILFDILDDFIGSVDVRDVPEPDASAGLGQGQGAC